MVKTWDQCGVDKGKVTAAIVRADRPQDVQQLQLVPGQDTLMVNAAIMDDTNQPLNAPWVIDLPLST